MWLSTWRRRVRVQSFTGISPIRGGAIRSLPGWEGDTGGSGTVVKVAGSDQVEVRSGRYGVEAMRGTMTVGTLVVIKVGTAAEGGSLQAPLITETRTVLLTGGKSTGTTAVGTRSREAVIGVTTATSGMMATGLLTTISGGTLETVKGIAQEIGIAAGMCRALLCGDGLTPPNLFREVLHTSIDYFLLTYIAFRIGLLLLMFERHSCHKVLVRLPGRRAVWSKFISHFLELHLYEAMNQFLLFTYLPSYQTPLLKAPL